MILFWIIYHHSCPKCGEVPIITIMDVEFAAIQKGLLQENTQVIGYLPTEPNLG